MRWAGEHGEDVTILSLRSDRLGEFWRGFHRCGGALWVIWQRWGAPNGRRKPAQSTLFALNDAQESGTGHSRLSLLCRVLAEGESAPSARKFWTSVKLEMDPDQNPQTISKRDRERSRRLQGRGVARRGGRRGTLGDARAVASELRGTFRGGVPCYIASVASARHSNHVKMKKCTS